MKKLRVGLPHILSMMCFGCVLLQSLPAYATLCDFDVEERKSDIENFALPPTTCGEGEIVLVGLGPQQAKGPACMQRADIADRLRENLKRAGLLVSWTNVSQTDDNVIILSGAKIGYVDPPSLDLGDVRLSQFGYLEDGKKEKVVRVHKVELEHDAFSGAGFSLTGLRLYDLGFLYPIEDKRVQNMDDPDGILDPSAAITVDRVEFGTDSTAKIAIKNFCIDNSGTFAPSEDLTLKIEDMTIDLSKTEIPALKKMTAIYDPVQRIALDSLGQWDAQAGVLTVSSFDFAGINDPRTETGTSNVGTFDFDLALKVKGASGQLLKSAPNFGQMFIQKFIFQPQTVALTLWLNAVSLRAKMHCDFVFSPWTKCVPAVTKYFSQWIGDSALTKKFIDVMYAATQGTNDIWIKGAPVAPVTLHNILEAAISGDKRMLVSLNLTAALSNGDKYDAIK
jgi:hypothetical protein